MHWVVNQFLIFVTTDSHCVNTVEHQWLEHRWLFYHSFFKLVLKSLEFCSITADVNIFRDSSMVLILF